MGFETGFGLFIDFCLGLTEDILSNVHLALEFTVGWLVGFCFVLLLL